MHGDTIQRENEGGFTSLYALPRVVGREKELNQILQMFRNWNPPRVFFISGEGGIGKTRVVREALKRLRETLGAKGLAYVAEREVDLYLTTTHTSNGLADALYRAAPFLQEKRVEELMEEMWGLWAAGVAGQSAERRKEHLELFERVLGEACQEKPVIFALDTAERWVYTWMGEPEQRHFVGAWEWLKQLLKNQKNLYFIIAGRPESPSGRDASRALWEDLQGDFPEPLSYKMELKPLNEAGVQAYFQAILQIAEEHLKDPDPKRRADAGRIVRLLSNLPSQLVGRIAHWSEGNPIRLSLIIDYLLMGGTIAQLETVIASGHSEAWHVAFFEHLANHPDGAVRAQFDTIRTLAWLPKGADPTLLARVIGCNEEEAQQRLLAIEPYTFTKKHRHVSGGVRYFLHDELYFLLNEVLESNQDPTFEEQMDAVDAYYSQHVRCLLEELSQEFLPAEEEGTERCPPRERLSEYYLLRHAWMTERIYYDLKRDKERGLRQRYRYTRHADLAGDVALDMALEAEMLNFFDEPGAPSITDDLKRTVAGIVAMRPVVRAWVEGRYDAVTEVAEKLREDKNLMADLNNCAILDVWEAYARIMLGRDLKKAHGLLDHAIGETSQCAKERLAGDGLVLWRCKAILAFALRVKAYLLDNQGDLDRAIKHYRDSVKLWREVNLLAEVATTTRDLAYNLGRVGRFPEAEDLGLNGLNLFRQLGAPGQVGLTLSALAMIEIEQRHYRDAMYLARRALHIAQCIRFTRGEGLAALALSEAIRRLVGTSHVLSYEEKFDDLLRANTLAQRSLDAMTESKDRWYRIKALIELGCVIRDKIRLCRQMTQEELCHPIQLPRECDPSRLSRYAMESKYSLMEAEREALEYGYPPLAADAIANLAWLGFYAEDEELMERAEDLFKERFPDFWRNGTVADPPKEGRQIVSQEKLIWQQLGKLYVMKGAQVYREFEKIREPDKKILEDHVRETLREIGRLYTRALAYSQVRGENYGALLVGKQFIFDQLKKLTTTELHEICQGVQEAEEEMGIKKSAMREFLKGRSLWYCEEANNGRTP